MSCVVAPSISCSGPETALNQCLASQAIDESCAECLTDACDGLFPSVNDQTSCNTLSNLVCNGLTGQYEACSCTDSGGCELELDAYFGCIQMDLTRGELGCSADLCCVAESVGCPEPACPNGTLILGFCIEDCFSAANWVEVKGKGQVPIATLKVGDWVRTGTGGYSRVYSLGHWDHDAQAEYLQIYADNHLTNDPLIEISHSHLLYVNGKLSPASSIKVGDTIQGSGEYYTVTSISTVHRQGRYAPFTESGTIQVNGAIQASTYVDLSRYSPFDNLPGGFYHTLAHGYMAPLRWACQVDFSICQSQQQHSLGYAPWLLGTVSSYVRFFQPLPQPIQMGLVVMGSPIVCLLGSSPMVLLGVAFMITLMRRSIKKNKAKHSTKLVA